MLNLLSKNLLKQILDAKHQIHVLHFCHAFYIQILFLRLIDVDLAPPIQERVKEALQVGASLLLPPLHEKMELLHSLLPQGPDRWDSLSKGQVRLCILENYISWSSFQGFYSGFLPTKYFLIFN